MPAPEGGKVFVAPVGVRDSAHVGRLTPSGSRLGSIPSLRARATRGTSLCSLALPALRAAGHLPRLGARRPLRGRSSGPRVLGGGALGPQGQDPPRVLWGLSSLRTYKTRGGHRTRPPSPRPLGPSNQKITRISAYDYQLAHTVVTRSSRRLPSSRDARVSSAHPPSPTVSRYPSLSIHLCPGPSP